MIAKKHIDTLQVAFTNSEYQYPERFTIAGGRNYKL